MGALIMALALDTGLADRLKRQTASEVVFIAFDTLGVPRVAASTLPAGTLDEALRKRTAEANGSRQCSQAGSG